MVFDLAWVNKALAIESAGAQTLAFSGVSTDTRALESGQLFVALKGPNFDGHNFIGQAFAQGAAAALVNKEYAAADNSLALLRVDDTLKSLGDLAHAWREELSLKVLAVTGSSGKTTTKEMLAAILRNRYRVGKTAGNYNNLIGLPLTLFSLTSQHSAAVLEMGMSWPGEIARLSEIADPDVGIITNVGPAHLQNLGSIKNIAKAKTELWQNMGHMAIAIVNMDDPLLAPWQRKLKGRVVSFGQENPAMVTASEAKASSFEQSFKLNLPASQPVSVKLKAPGSHNRQNALAAAAAATALGLNGREIAEGLSGYHPLEGRFRLVLAPNGTRILDDAYNANPASMAAALNSMTELRHRQDNVQRTIAVLADMLELGKDSQELHKQLGGLVAQSGVDQLLALGGQATYIAKGAVRAGLDNTMVFEHMSDLQKYLQQNLKSGDMVLIKGSNSMGMEKLVKFLAKELV